jgi:hypothetical protein
MDYCSLAKDNIDLINYKPAYIKTLWLRGAGMAVNIYTECWTLQKARRKNFEHFHRKETMNGDINAMNLTQTLHKQHVHY